ncbi:hypothetical protein CAFE_06010 [Caprobacter fermentans]|uniref:NAD(P)-dependent oxidoreductase n=1 Tax=Caproicibacter fermentans TaxID=2576756 RepID=A0A6N8HVV5_9FIRM|nr:NAD(P)-dependent oxidoreductase [Caproicibacter fermentans]MVB09931.1 hypothetical protein [Caproicibacter fermentans]
MNSLVGDTGFVGSNLLAESRGFFGGLYHSGNIGEAYGTKPDLLVYAGVRAEKFLADRFPDRDLADVEEAFSNIERIDPKRLVLISTIDVFSEPRGVDEKSAVSLSGLSPYGSNRFHLEQLVRGSGRDCLIVRLPGLYGVNLKKNFIFDLIHVIPSLLTDRKFTELSAREPRLRDFYQDQGNGFYRCGAMNAEDRKMLKAMFERLEFSAVNFTDSRAIFQFYPLSCLWGHLMRALEERLPLIHLATEPVRISDLYRFVTGREFHNELAKAVPDYGFKTIYANQWGGKNGYLFDREYVMRDIKNFVERYRPQ